MIEGLFSPWHLVIIAVTAFLVLGPRRLSRRWHDFNATVQHWADGEDQTTQPGNQLGAGGPPDVERRSLSYRVGSRLRRRRP